VAKLHVAFVVNVSNYVQTLLNVNGDNLTELESHLAEAPIELIAMPSVDI